MRKFIFSTLVAMTAVTLCAAEKNITAPEKENALENAEKMRPPRPPRRRPLSREEFRRGRGIWMAFARMSVEEQRKMRKLQRSEPENFRKIMEEKADKLFVAEQQRRQKIADIVKKYQKSGDSAEKEKLSAELRTIIKERFDRQLNAMRDDLERTRIRAQRLEKELKKREKNSDAIINAITQKHLTGKKSRKKVTPDSGGAESL